MYPYFNNQMYQQQPSQANLVSVRSENEAMSYPIAPGNSITFKDETAPYVYTKTMGLSPLDQPKFEKYRLVKEGDAETPAYITKNELEALISDIDELKDDVEYLKRKPTAKRKEVVDA